MQRGTGGGWPRASPRCWRSPLGGGYLASAGQTPPHGLQAGAPIDGIRCGSMEGQAEHIHVHVALFWRGRLVTIPAYVGIPYNQNVVGNYCYYWLHTHATTNVVHIEAPASGTYTLGQFMDIWRDTALWDSHSLLAQVPVIDASFVAALQGAAPRDIHVYVGHTLVYQSYRDVAFADHRDITVELGKPLTSPVATFDWTHWQAL